MEEADFGGNAWDLVVVDACDPMEDDCRKGYIGGTTDKANLDVRGGLSKGGIRMRVHAL